MRRICAYAGVWCFALAWPAAAQNTSHFTFSVGGGFTEPTARTNHRLDTGFNINAGAGWNFTPRFGVVGEFGFNRLGLTDAALTAAGVPDGATRIYSLTLNPIFRFHPQGRFDAYMIGGGGYYRRTVEFTQPGVGQVTLFDPFYGVFFPAAVPTSVVLGSFTQNKGGLNIGAGFTVRIKEDGNAKFFAETRYHYLFTAPVRTTILPVTFGFRW